MSEAINADYQELVYARLQALPDGMEISIGGGENLTKDELLAHVAKGDEIGKKMIAVEKEFFQALKDGSLYDILAE
jgi:hypothetical protein